MEKVSILYKQKPCEINTGLYNAIILKLLKSSMNIQFVTGVYAMFIYLTSYLRKPEHAVSDLIEKASRKAYRNDIKGKMVYIGNKYLTISIIYKLFSRSFSKCYFNIN